MTLSQAAIMLRCSPRKVIRLIHSQDPTKRLPAVRLGKREFYINIEDVERLRYPPHAAPRPH